MDSRFDVQYYRDRIKIKDYTKLKSIAYVKGGKRLPKSYNYSKTNTNYLYLRIGDIDEFGVVDYKQLKFISEDLYLKLKNYKISYNNLALAIVGATTGKVTRITYKENKKIILTENCAKIIIKNSNEIIPQYLEILLNSRLIQRQIQLNLIHTTLQKLSLDRVGNLKLPLIPDISTQKEIIKYYYDIFSAKQQKEAEAEKLINSIDDYLLTELRIELSEKENNTLNNRIYTTEITNVFGGRFDPFYYQNIFTSNINNINNSKYKICKLSKIIDGFLIKGKLPKDNEKNGECNVIQINSISKNSEIDTNNLLTSKNIFIESQKLKVNDILIVITGATIGKIAIWDKELSKEYYLGGDLIKFQVNQDVNTHFIFSYLKSKVAQIQIQSDITGATNGHLSPSDVKNIIIPIPPIKKQNEIAEHIKGIRHKAKQLQINAINDLEKAKIEIEKMILGERK